MNFEDVLVLSTRYKRGTLLIEESLWLRITHHVEPFITDWGWPDPTGEWEVRDKELFKLASGTKHQWLCHQGAELFLLAKLKEPYLSQYKAAIAERTVMNL